MKIFSNLFGARAQYLMIKSAYDEEKQKDIIGAIVFYAFALAFLLSATLSSITFAVYQRKLNKHKIGLAALIVSLTCLAICVIGTILIIVFML